MIWPSLLIPFCGCFPPELALSFSSVVLVLIGPDERGLVYILPELAFHLLSFFTLLVLPMYFMMDLNNELKGLGSFRLFLLPFGLSLLAVEEVVMAN
jgi:hypothetical protein